jgi:UTP-glucose-1-phosphate uridylyltransferase
MTDYLLRVEDVRKNLGGKEILRSASLNMHKGDTKMAVELRRIETMAEIVYVRQKEALGLGHAILVARDLMNDEPFAVLLGDDVVVVRVA